MGRVNTALGKFEDAKPEFANAIFFMSKFQGAEAVGTSMGYFRLGDVYMAQGLLEAALAFFDKVVDIWDKVGNRQVSDTPTWGTLAEVWRKHYMKVRLEVVLAAWFLLPLYRSCSKYRTC